MERLRSEYPDFIDWIEETSGWLNELEKTAATCNQNQKCLDTLEAQALDEWVESRRQLVDNGAPAGLVDAVNSIESLCRIEGIEESFRAPKLSEARAWASKLYKKLRKDFLDVSTTRTALGQRMTQLYFTFVDHRRKQGRQGIWRSHSYPFLNNFSKTMMISQ